MTELAGPSPWPPPQNAVLSLWAPRQGPYSAWSTWHEALAQVEWQVRESSLPGRASADVSLSRRVHSRGQHVFTGCLLCLGTGTGTQRARGKAVRTPRGLRGQGERPAGAKALRPGGASCVRAAEGGRCLRELQRRECAAGKALRGAVGQSTWGRQEGHHPGGSWVCWKAAGSFGGGGLTCRDL